MDQDLKTFLQYKTISADPSHNDDMIACCNWLKDYLQNLNFTTDIWTTSGHPTLYATHHNASNDAPTVLIYHHYDVQPVDPLEEWTSPPFEPTEHDGIITARGAQDNKGQCYATLTALRTMLANNNTLPVNVTIIIDGEEEIASPGLSTIVVNKSSELQADYLLIADGGIPAINTPAVTLGIRGLVAMTLSLTDTITDLHSGSHGGIVTNPNHALVTLLAQLHDDHGRVTVPGFYDNLTPPSPEEYQHISFEFDDANYNKLFGTSPLGGEDDYSPNESAWIRPTLEINGINGGYTGYGFKTVIPKTATAHISCRLVPQQDPIDISNKIATHIKKLAPPHMKTTITTLPGTGKAVRIPPSSPIVNVVKKAYESLLNTPCKLVYDGGSIPLVHTLANASNATPILIGLGLPDDNMHAINEHYSISRITQGAQLMQTLLNTL